MKKYLTVFLMLFFAYSSMAFDYQMPDSKIFLKPAIDNYNKNLNPNDFFKASKGVDKNFLNEFKSHVKATNIQEFWKADLIGDTVYFKKNNYMVSMQVLEVVTISQYELKINGKTVSVNLKDGFSKNLSSLKSTFIIHSASVWDLIIPQANAADIKIPNKELDEALSSALSGIESFNSFFRSDLKTEKIRFCQLSENEKSSFHAQSDDKLFEEIKYFIQIQKKYVKDEVESRKFNLSEDNCIGDCKILQEFQDCLNQLASKRQRAIEDRKIHGFSCLKKYEVNFKDKHEGNYLFLNSNLLNTTYLENFRDSYLAQDNSLKVAEHDICKIKINDYEIKNCKEMLLKRKAALELTCPANADKATLAIKSTSSNLGTSVGAGSK